MCAKSQNIYWQPCTQNEVPGVVDARVADDGEDGTQGVTDWSLLDICH